MQNHAEVPADTFKPKTFLFIKLAYQIFDFIFLPGFPFQ